ncbi:hypothetical protein EAF04_010082 [Stromatinia cepivora]|nr:hypothetical protein EAF04_010082 [Stromatinia cepivora]
MNTTAQGSRRSPRQPPRVRPNCIFDSYYNNKFPHIWPRKRKRSKVRDEGDNQAKKHPATVGQTTSTSKHTSSSTSTKSKSTTNSVVGLTKDETDVLPGSKSDHNTQFDTLLATMTEGEQFLASFKRNAIAYRDPTPDLNSKLRVAETGIRESAAAFSGEIAYLKRDVMARDDEVGRLKEKNDMLKKDKEEIARLDQRNRELESAMEKQAAKLKELESWRKQMRTMLIGGEAEL